jgi:hypothetical protein
MKETVTENNKIKVKTNKEIELDIDGHEVSISRDQAEHLKSQLEYALGYTTLDETALENNLAEMGKQVEAMLTSFTNIFSEEYLPKIVLRTRM